MSVSWTIEPVWPRVQVDGEFQVVMDEACSSVEHQAPSPGGGREDPRRPPGGAESTGAGSWRA